MKRINDECYFSWQVQYLVKFKCHFSWQAQYSVKFGMIAGCIFNYKMLVVGVKSSLGREAGRGLTVSWSDHSRVMLGSWSDRPGIGNDASAFFHKISLRFWTVIFRGRRSIW